MNRRLRPTAVLRWAAALGAGGMAVLALAWRGHLPGGQRLRLWVSEKRHADRISGFAAEAASVPAGAVVFLGSSTISNFPFATAYPGAPYLDRGVGGDTTLGALARLDGSLPVQRPAGVVIYTGANDLRGYHMAPEVIAGHMTRLLDALSARFPAVPVALVEVMPVCEPEGGEPARLQALNDSLGALAGARGAAFVRTHRPPLTDATGRLAPLLSADGEHLNAAGYAVLASWITEDGGAATAPLRAPAR